MLVCVLVSCCSQTSCRSCPRPSRTSTSASASASTATRPTTSRSSRSPRTSCPFPFPFPSPFPLPNQTAKVPCAVHIFLHILELSPLHASLFTCIRRVQLYTCTRMHWLEYEFCLSLCSIFLFFCARLVSRRVPSQIVALTCMCVCMSFCTFS